MFGSAKLNEYTAEEKEWLRGVKVSKGRPKLPYEVQLVAFIDILGIKEQVIKSGDEASKIVDMMESIRKNIETLCHEYTETKQIRLLQIGDGFYFVADKSCVNEVCNILAEIQWQVLVQWRELIRGSLTAGKVRVGKDNNFFIGQAIVEAFELERKNAIFPRIICEESKIEEYVGKGIIDNITYINTDQDKLKYINYIRYKVDNDGLTEKKLKELIIDQGVGDALKKEYEALIGENKGAAQKYGWLFSQLEPYKVQIIT